MNEEAKVNPELFRHHLHIDLSAPIATSIDPLPAGTIFCNNDLITTAGVNPGFCYFICLPGFVNFDLHSYNGCERAVSPALIPFRDVLPAPGGQAVPANTAYRFPIVGLPQPYFGTFGGFLIGDYEVEYYLAWLNTIGVSLPITRPTGVETMNFQISVNLNLMPAIVKQPILWY